MPLNWRARIEQQPSLWQFDRWPVITADCVPTGRRKIFYRNQKIVAKVLSGSPLKAVAKEHQITQARITQLLDRCLGGEEDESPPLTYGLIPYAVVITKQRHAPLPSMRSSQGSACAFQGLLQSAPVLREKLDELILAKLKDAAYAQRLEPQWFHGEFKRLLGEIHWPADRYPYTSPSLAYESVRRYLHTRSSTLQATLRRPCVSSQASGTQSDHYRALNTIQIDEHVLDLHNRVHLQLNEELIPLRLARASVMVAIDVGTSCVLGYHMALTQHPNQQDILTLFDNCLKPWQPLTLTTPGFSYAEGACFPSGSSEDFPLSFGNIQLDNALVHLSRSVIDLLCTQQGATVSFGFPGQPTTRHLVESVFDYICSHASHRFAATTGSHPNDPIKESRKNRKRIPTVSVRTLEEALSILLTEYNVTPRAHLGHATPLALFRHHCRHHFVRYTPMDQYSRWQPLIGEKVVPVHWRKDEHRAPYINFFYDRYQGEGLSEVAHRERNILLRFDRRDIRIVQAYSLRGDDLGPLRASRSWQRFPHGVSTRQLIHRLCREQKFQARDPLANYFRYLLEHKGQPKSALQLLRVYQEYTQEKEAALVLDPPAPFFGPILPPTEAPVLPWRPDLANHRE
jgi:hypothetical protein